MSTCNCPSLFNPGKIGPIETRNRSVMPAMGLSSTEGGYINDICIRHYVERAKGGMGLIVVEVACVEYPAGLNTANMIRVDDDKFIPGLKKLASAIHEAGAKCVVEISHTGRGARRMITGLQPVAPSPIAMPMMYITGVENEVPRELTIPEIHRIEDEYAAAAYRLKQAGFDGVELHSTGYYLCSQFISTRSNQRTDEYGGSAENRFRFVAEICEKTKKLCGDDFGLLVKCTLFQAPAKDNPVPGISVEDGKYFVKRMVELGVDAIEVMGGGTKVMPEDTDVPFTASKAIPMAALAKIYRDYAYETFGPKMKTQFISGGDVRTAEHCETVLTQGIGDYVYIGRSCIVDPNFVNLLKEGRDAEIHPCIGCYVCVGDQLHGGAHSHCSGNGAMASDSRFDLPPADKVKKVIVVGGGPIGVEAAKVLKLRGHDVTIMEKSDKLGGQLYYAMAPLHKDHFKALIPYLKATVEANNIPVIYNTEATVESVLALDPDVVICATGVRPGRLPVPGVDLPHVLSGKDYLIGAKVVPGKRVVVIGGGDVGCEVAEKLGAEGHEVSLVEMTDVLAPGYMFGNRCCLMHQLRRWGVNEYLGTKCYAIYENEVEVSDKIGFRFKLPCDNVIICTGDPSDNKLAEELKGKVPQVFNIGDSSKPANLASGHAEAYKLAREL